MNLIKGKMPLFCISNIIASFACTSFLGTTGYYTTALVGQNEKQELLEADDVEPLSRLGEGDEKIFDNVIEIPDLQEIVTKVEQSKKTTTVKKVKATSTVTKKEVKATTTYTPAKYNEVTGSAIVSYAKKYLGLRYSSGLSLSTGTDCSGFTKLIYREFGITLSRTANGQAKSGTYVRKSDLQKGDLVFYSNGSGRITHVAIYIGNSQVIHESNPRHGVKISSVNMMQYITARRVINSTANKIVEEKIEKEKEELNKQTSVSSETKEVTTDVNESIPTTESTTSTNTNVGTTSEVKENININDGQSTQTEEVKPEEKKEENIENTTGNTTESTITTVSDTSTKEEIKQEEKKENNMDVKEEVSTKQETDINVTEN